MACHRCSRAQSSRAGRGCTAPCIASWELDGTDRGRSRHIRCTGRVRGLGDAQLGRRCEASGPLAKEHSLRSRVTRALAASIVGVVGFAAGSQAADRKEVVHFLKRHSSATIHGTIQGGTGVVYQLGASEGQTMSVHLQPSHDACYFNVLPPGGGLKAIFIGSTSGNDLSSTLAASGAYRVQVYLIRSAARRTVDPPSTARPTRGRTGPTRSSADSMRRATSSKSCLSTATVSNPRGEVGVPT